MKELFPVIPLGHYYKDKRWVLLGDYTISGFTIPAGFKTDIDSIPRWIPFLFAILKHRAIEASVLHDYLYSIKYDRAQADLFYRQAMKVTKVNPFIREMIYTGVRLFGWIWYDRVGKESSTGDRK
jgi:hypothetical protein